MSCPIQLTGGPTAWRVRMRHFFEDLLAFVHGQPDTWETK